MQPQSLPTRFGIALCIVGGILAFVGYFFPLVSFLDPQHPTFFVSPLIPFFAIGVIGLSTLAAGKHIFGLTLLGMIVIVGWLLAHLFFSILKLVETQIGGGTSSLAPGFWLPFCGFLLSGIGLAIVFLGDRAGGLRRRTISSNIADNE